MTPIPRWTLAHITDVTSVVLPDNVTDSTVGDLHKALDTWLTDPARFAEHIALLVDIHLTAHWSRGDPAELDRAVAVWSRLSLDTLAVNGLITTRLELIGHQMHFALARRSGGNKDLAAAVIDRCTKIREELAQLRSDSLMRDIANNASKWAQLVADAEQWQAAATASDLATRAYDQLVLSQPLDQRSSDIAKYRALTLNSASALVRAGRAREAVRTVEDGRQRIFRALGAGAEAEVLAKREPVLFEQFTALGQEWEKTRVAVFRAEGPVAITAARQAHKQAETRLAELLETIRKVPGLSRFQWKLGFSEIAAATKDGPLLYLWSGKFATCLVLVLPDGSTRQAACQPGSDYVDELVDVWVAALEPDAQVDGFSRMRTCGYVSHIVREILAPPIAELLTAQWKMPEDYTGWRWGVVTLIVSGSLCHIPCHALQPVLRDEDRGSSHIMPLKYAPSARQLLITQETPRSARSTTRLLSLADPQTPANLPPLPCSLLEQELLGELSDDKLLLNGSAATRAALLEHLANADIVHLACHGRVANGLRGSSLELADGPMGFNELWDRGSLSHVSLVVLSACSSGRQDHRIPEETTDVGSLLLALGAPAVVATLWPVDDLAAALFVCGMFNFWWQEGLPSDAAACAAGQWLKGQTNRDLLAIAEAEPRWAPHVRRYVRGLPMNMKRFDEPYYWAAFAYFGASIEAARPRVMDYR